MYSDEKDLHEYARGMRKQVAEKEAAVEYVNGKMYDRKDGTYQYKILGKKESASSYGIKTQTVKKAKEALKVAPKELLRSMVKVQRITELMTSPNASDEIENIGKKGVNLLVSMTSSAFRKMTHAAGVFFLWIAGIISPFILIFAAGVILLISSYGSAGSPHTNKNTESFGENVSSSLSEPRIINSDENTLSILMNAWYFSDNPFYQSGYGMPNCTCYAWGRRAEIEGEAPSLPTGNAGGWYEANIRSGAYTYGQEPQVGAVAVWRYPGTRDSGHVAVVEVINEDGSFICSNSAWQSTFFYVQTWTMDSIRDWSHRNAVFEGFIYMNPGDK